MMRLVTNHYRRWVNYGIVYVCAAMLSCSTGCEQKGSGEVNWWIEQASLSARGIEDEAKRDQAYIEIVRVQMQMGDFAGAYLMLENVVDGEKPWLYNEILKGQAESGDVAGAKAAAGKIENGTFKAMAGEDIAIVQAGAGDMAGALATAGLIESAMHQAQAYCAIGRVQAEGGDFAGGYETVEMIVEPNYFRSLSRSKIVEALTAAGQLDGARALAEKIVDAGCRGRAWGAIAKKLTEMGDMTEAEKTAESMDATVDKVMVCSDIALAYSHQGDSAAAIRLFSDVLTTAKEMGEDETGIDIRRYILKAMLLAGETERAMKLAEGTPRRIRRWWFYRDIVDVLAAQGDFVRAKSLAKKIEEPSIKDQALTTITLEQVKQVEVEEGKALAATLDDLDLQVQVYCALAERQAESGDMEGAKATLAEAQDMANGSLSLVVMTRLEIRDVRGAWADARRLPDEDKQKKLKAFRMVASAQAGTGDMASIKKWVASQSDAEFITYLYLGAAEGLLERMFHP